METEVLVLDHDALALDRLGHENGLIEVVRRRHERPAQFGFGRVRHEGDAVDRADVDAGVALDAGGRREDGLDVAVEAAARFAERLLESVKPSSTSVRRFLSAAARSTCGTAKRRSSVIALS